MSSLPVGILLAAGQSRRFGSNKLLHPVTDDTSMLMVTAEKLTSVLPDTVAVINQGMAGCTAQLEQLGMQVVINEQAEQGMGGSIACGVCARPDASGWLINLADMPYIKTATILLVAQKLKDGCDLVAPVFEQKRGHPVGFGRGYRDELIALQEDIGARDIIARSQSSLVLVPTSDAGVLVDVDYVNDIL